ncbi:MAG: hypothetical protein U0M70_06115 [Eubacteriales bacterium]|jgi:vacuolar-type H+-ATPase subunit H|uniref:ATPase n=1 Tax=Baileyella intestinalis TaxID=2606709 RepID=A0A6A8MAX4_9FIRM|nr:hypothetical protein [Baileyella intestinalis]MCI7686216.1 hypothetical protein [Clostridiales bacterium]MDD5875446.1 hypothetical protein [Baileyella intestinalis]MDY2994901.1 hypothetical protein [Baileyella intestinalis]MST69004.1 hypothetical protein [Baileyella intestinalis]
MSDESIRVMSLLDELEDLVTNASKVPFSDKTIVDGDELKSIIDDIRLSLPKDIQQARWVKDEQERILNEAKSEYDKVIVAAKRQAEYLVENDIVKKEAEKRANALVNEAESHSRYIKLRAYEYIDKMLYDMQNEMAGLANEFIQPMNEKFADIINDVNGKVNGNRQEVKDMASRLQDNVENTAADRAAVPAPDYSDDADYDGNKYQQPEFDRDGEDD